MTIKRLKPKARRDALIEAAIALCADGFTYQTFNGKDVADRAQVQRPTIYHYFDSIDDLRAEVLRKAVRDNIMHVIVQGIAAGQLAADFGQSA